MAGLGFSGLACDEWAANTVGTSKGQLQDVAMRLLTETQQSMHSPRKVVRFFTYKIQDDKALTGRVVVLGNVR